MAADRPDGSDGGVRDPDSGPLRCRRVDHQVQRSVPLRRKTQLDLLQRPDWKQQGESNPVGNESRTHVPQTKRESRGPFDKNKRTS